MSWAERIFGEMSLRQVRIRLEGGQSFVTVEEYTPHGRPPSTPKILDMCVYADGLDVCLVLPQPMSCVSYNWPVWLQPTGRGRGLGVPSGGQLTTPVVPQTPADALLNEILRESTTEHRVKVQRLAQLLGILGDSAVADAVSSPDSVSDGGASTSSSSGVSSGASEDVIVIDDDDDDAVDEVDGGGGMEVDGPLDLSRQDGAASSDSAFESSENEEEIDVLRCPDCGVGVVDASGNCPSCLFDECATATASGESAVGV